MKVIGITGGIGTGKSEVLHYIGENYNAFILESDRLAHELEMPGRPAYEGIVNAFGFGVLTADRLIDRDALGTLVMNDPAKLSTLNAIVHPAVNSFIAADIMEKRGSGICSLYVIEAALLLQCGYDKICDEIVAVSSDKNKRIERLISSRGYTRDKAESFISNQPGDDFYTGGADYVIDNSGGLSDLQAAVREYIDMVLSKDNE